jgi:hypothetical protein
VGGRAIYAIISFGGFLGIGERFHPVPWSLLGYTVERGGFVVPLDKSALETAPHYDATEIRELGGLRRRTYGEAIFIYHDLTAPAPIGEAKGSVASVSQAPYGTAS